MTTALGHDINDFYQNGFPLDSYTEETPDWLEEHFDENDNLALEPAKEYDISEFGYIIDASDNIQEFSAVFLKWKNSKGLTTFIVSVPTDKTNKFSQLIESTAWATIKS